ncbi:MAG TPA: DUF4893 domain-containing protein [Rhizomicrobium sp.]|jgi:hypothetical protein|nr:DUF4893 domain-containing protein [Rhizomicrobium sp.]
MRPNLSDLALAAAALMFTATAASAGWQDQASAFDQKRLAALAEAKQKGLAEAQAGSGTGDASAIRSALEPASHAPSPGEIAGAWRCRTIKLGGVTPYVVYSWFNCRIANRGGGLFLEKTSGSTRTSGYLYPGDGGMVYLGAASVTGEPQHAYSGNGASAGAAATPDDQIGILTAIDARHARLEMPYPVQESTFDVLELKR